MTPFEELGCTKDNLFVVCSDSTTFIKGSIVKLDMDDGSDSPRFKIVKGTCKFRDGLAHVTLSYLSKVTTNPESYHLDAIVRAIHEISGAFMFEDTPQGSDYWFDVISNLSQLHTLAKEHNNE